MKNTFLLQRTRFATIALVLICAGIVSAGVWRVRALQGGANPPSHDQNRQALHLQLRNGLGKEVKITTPKNSPEQIKQSVDSVAKFIEDRSGLILNKDVKDRLAVLEQRTLTRQNRRISVNELVDILTATTIDRLSTLTDKEINQTGAALDNSGEIILRGSGKGHLKSDEFASTAKNVRDLSRQGDATFRSNVRAAVQEEVSNRVPVYSEALPGHFGGVSQIGITPVQAMLIAYSVASDDFLGQSQQTLDATQELLYAKMKDKGYKQGRKPSKAFGSEGYLFATPLNVVLDGATMKKLLDSINERGAL